MAIHDRDEEETPLDPAAERLRRKLTRLLMVSGALMMLGFIAVFAAIVYKTSQGAPDVAARQPVEATVAIPAGAELIASALDGERALLTIRGNDGSTSLVLVDLPTGETVGRYVLQAR